MESIDAVLQRLVRPVAGGPAGAAPPPDPPARPACPLCRNRRWFRRDVPVGHPDFGGLQACVCIAAEVAARQYATLLPQSQLETLADCTFERFNPTIPGVAEGFMAAQDYAAAVRDQQAGWLVLQGTPGSGKTHLAAAIGHTVLAGGIPVYFTAAPDLLDCLRATFDPESPVRFDAFFAQVQRVPLLILDDLGAEQPTLWVREKLFQILNHRYVAQLPTVVTTNFLLSDRTAFDARLASRLGDRRHGTVLPLTAADYRQQG